VNSDVVAKKTSKPAMKNTTRARKRQTVGESIVQGLKEAIAWTKGENDNVRVTLVQAPEVDGRRVPNLWRSSGRSQRTL